MWDKNLKNIYPWLFIIISFCCNLACKKEFHIKLKKLDSQFFENLAQTSAWEPDAAHWFPARLNVFFQLEAMEIDPSVLFDGLLHDPPTNIFNRFNYRVSGILLLR